MSVYDIDTGEQVFRASYDTWGRQVVEQNDINLQHGYCGHDMLSDYELIDMGGRVYDPVIGRFLSCDNYVQEPDNSQNFNRYSYCLNNPLRYTDPDGEFWWIVAGAVGAYIGGAMANNWQMNPAKWNYSYAGTYLGMGIGAITGGTGGGAVLAGTASVSMNALTPFVSVNATYGCLGTYTNGWSYGWETVAGGGAVISKHGYSDEAVKYGIDAQVADIAQTYAAYESGYDYNWDFSAFAAVTPFTAVLAADDASVIGVADDPVAGLLLTGALCKTAYDNRANLEHAKDRAIASIDRMKNLTLNCRPGYVYHLVATQNDYYKNVRTGKQVYLKKGDTWKIGETINGEARYGQKYLQDHRVSMVQSSPYMTDKYLLWIEERLQLIEYANKYRTLPPGNKMFK